MIIQLLLVGAVLADILNQKLERFQKDNQKQFVPIEILEECRKQSRDTRIGKIRNGDMKFWYGLDEMNNKFVNNGFEKYWFQLDIVQNQEYQVEISGKFLYDVGSNKYTDIRVKSLSKSVYPKNKQQPQNQLQMNVLKNSIAGQFDMVQPQFNFTQKQTKQDSSVINLDKLWKQKFRKYDLDLNKKKIVIDQLLSRMNHDKRMAILEYDDIECREYKDMKLCYMKVLFQSENHIHSIKVQFLDKVSKIIIMSIDDLTYKSNNE